MGRQCRAEGGGPPHLVRLTVSDARATLTFRGRSVTLRQDRGGHRGNGYARGEALTITVPNKELVEVDLVRGSDRRWQLAAVKLTHPPRTSISSADQPVPGFSETFYAYLSQTNDNGSGFAGYTGYIPPEHSRLDFLTQVLELSTALQAGDASRPRASSSIRSQPTAPGRAQTRHLAKTPRR